MKAIQIRTVMTTIMVLLISVTALWAQTAITGKGEVIAVRFLELKADVDTTEFEKFVREEYNPALEGTVPGLKEFIAKSDRGSQVGSYALFIIFDSKIVRDLMIPTQGKMEAWISKIMEDQKLWPIWDKLTSYLIQDSLNKFNDFVVLK